MSSESGSSFSITPDISLSPVYSLSPVCSYCGKGDIKLTACKCKIVFYCCVQCRAQDSTHKDLCRLDFTRVMTLFMHDARGATAKDHFSLYLSEKLSVIEDERYKGLMAFSFSTYICSIPDPAHKKQKAKMETLHSPSFRLIDAAQLEDHSEGAFAKQIGRIIEMAKRFATNPNVLVLVIEPKFIGSHHLIAFNLMTKEKPPKNRRAKALLDTIRSYFAVCVLQIKKPTLPSTTSTTTTTTSFSSDNKDVKEVKKR